MINPKLIEHIFNAASIQRWNDYPRTVELVELDKQSHKFIIAYLIAKMEKDVNMLHLIEAGIFEFLRRIVVTDIRPDVFHKAIEKKTNEINAWVLEQLEDGLKDVEGGKFLSRFKEYLTNQYMYKKERFILKAASYISTKWEFSIVYQASQFLSGIDRVKESVDEEYEDYFELVGVQKMALGKKLSKLIDLSGRLRFQKRWAQTPRVPQTSVLGHMLVVAILAYFYSLKIGACKTRVESNFFCALFHDLPEALTRDIISPVKYSVSGLDDIISEYEIELIKNEILPCVGLSFKDEFSYLLGLFESEKNEFRNRIYNETKALKVENPNNFNSNEFHTIDGNALKCCDKLAAFIEAVVSIGHGVKSKELIKACEHIKMSLKEKNDLNVDFYKLAEEIEEYI